MAILRDDEIRRLLKFLNSQIPNKEKLALIENELRGDFGAEILREPEFLNYFPAMLTEFVFDEMQWKLRVIPYTKMRMVQRGIRLGAVKLLFTHFLKFCS